MKIRLLSMTTLLVTMTLLAAGSPAGAQTVVDLKGTTVDVVVKGGYIRARLVAIDDTSVTIQAKKAPPKTIPLSDVLRVEARKKDSLVNGAAYTALALMGWCALSCAQGLNSMSELPAAVLAAGVWGAGIGAAVDAARPTKVTLYQRPSAATVPRRAALSISFRF